jgi:hypothetical protein
VTTFIKADEQNHSLYNYVNVLNQECDILEEQNKGHDNKIDKYKRMGQEAQLSKDEQMKALKKRASELEGQLDLSNRECSEVLSNF